MIQLQTAFVASDIVILVSLLGILIFLWSMQYGTVSKSSQERLTLQDLDPDLHYEVLSQFERDGRWYMVAIDNDYDAALRDPRVYEIVSKLEMGDKRYLRVEKSDDKITNIEFEKYAPVIELRC